MNYAQWLERFRQNRQHRTEPDWHAPITLPPAHIAALIPSLEQFELGDGGGPASLIAHDAESFRGSSDELRAVVDAWFTEEREHSRLLGCAVKRFGGRRIESHWSFTAFCTCRRVLGVRFELQVLLLTEIVSTAFYRVLRRHTADQPVKDMCALILRDEAGHVTFHRDRLAAAGRTPWGLCGLLWQFQFWVCGHGAATVLWMSHGKCLTILGGSRAEYYQEVRLEISRFVRRLNGVTTRQTLKTLSVSGMSVLPSTQLTHSS